MVYATAEELGLEYSGKLHTMANQLFDAYLTPKIHHDIGAYGILTSFDENGLTIISYRDPSVTDTYAVYKGLGDFIEISELTQEQIDRYIINEYSAYAKPESKLTGAINALRLNGKPDDYKLNILREIKFFTLEDFKLMAKAFDKLGSEGLRYTAGGAAAIEANADLFDQLIPIQ